MGPRATHKQQVATTRTRALHPAKHPLSNCSNTRCCADADNEVDALRQDEAAPRKRAQLSNTEAAPPGRSVRACQHFSGQMQRLPSLLRCDPARPPSTSHLGCLQMTRPVSSGSGQSLEKACPGCPSTLNSPHRQVARSPRCGHRCGGRGPHPPCCPGPWRTFWISSARDKAEWAALTAAHTGHVL